MRCTSPAGMASGQCSRHSARPAGPLAGRRRARAAAQTSSRPGSAGGTGIPAAGPQGRAARPRCSATRWSQADRRAQQLAGIRVLRVGRRRRRPAPCSTIRPAYMTATRSHASAMMPRLWVISRIEVSKLRFTSARMRGSAPRQGRRARWSAHRRRRTGPQHQRQRDQDPLPHTAGELVRIFSNRVGGIPIARERFERTLRGSRLTQIRLVGLSTLPRNGADPHQRIEPGHRLLEDHPERRPRSYRSSAAAGRRDCGPRSDLAAGHRAVRQQPEQAAASVDFPQPDSPTRPRVSPCTEVEAEPVDRLHRPAVGAVPDPQVADLNHRIDPDLVTRQRATPPAGCPISRREMSPVNRRCRSSGFTTSLRPSPTRVRPVTSRTMPGRGTARSTSSRRRRRRRRAES